MPAHHLSRLVAATLLLSCAAAQSASLSLTPISQSVVVGNDVSVQLTMDFSDDPTVGGGVDIFFDDSILQFLSFSFDAALADDPQLRFSPLVSANRLESLAFGEFGGLSGPAVVGTLVFTAVNAGAVNFTMAQNDTIAGGFYSAVTFDPQNVTFNSASVNVSTVPLPAAGWLFMGGLGLLAAARKHAAE